MFLCIDVCICTLHRKMLGVYLRLIHFTIMEKTLYV